MGDVVVENRYEESIMYQKILGLEEPITRDICVRRDIKIPMRDGTLLSADYWVPSSGGDGLPTLLIRSPYKHQGGIEDILVKPLVERGFQAILCSIRGLEGSEGKYEIMGNEREDGLDTIDWIIRQPWFGDSIIMHGPSYQGLVQWALAGELPPQVKMLIPSESSSNMAHSFLNKRPFALEMSLGWGMFMKYQKEEDPVAAWNKVCDQAYKAFWTLPLCDVDKKGIGEHFYIAQQIFSTHSGSTYSEDIKNLRVPMCMVGGWHDLFLADQLRDFEIMQNAGCPVYITVGEWQHYAAEMSIMPVQEALTYGLPVALGEKMPEHPKVKLYVMGAEEWRNYEKWPPAGFKMAQFYLQAAGRLSMEKPCESDPDRYCYDPADPTPAVGGKHLMEFPGVLAGRIDQAKLENRSDVLIYTSSVLEEDMEMIGVPKAKIWFNSSLEYADLFVKVCDVSPDGDSVYVCDGIISLEDAKKIDRREILLNPTAYVFKAGHCIRVQVSSGAFPAYNRNMGTGEDIFTDVEMCAADQSVYHDPSKPSYVELPIKKA